jgi:RNA polymerase subunit RPABC4/transcription elongation factor Spt4
MRAFMRRAITKNESQISSSEPTWTCVKCVLVNEASVTTCRKCSSSQPSHQNKDNQDPPIKLSLQNIVAEKPCPTCTVLNPVNKSFCFVCESPLLNEMTTKKINKISANGDSGKENGIVDESHKCGSNVILDPDNHFERKYRTVYGNETSGMHIPKKNESV